MINFALTEKLGKRNSEFQMGFEPTTLRDLVGCSTIELLETVVSKGKMWVLTRTADPHFTLAHHRVSSSSVVEHPTRSRRVVASNPIWNSEFLFPRFSVNAKFIEHKVPRKNGTFLK